MRRFLRLLALLALGFGIYCFGYVTLTVPAIAATGPAIILVALCVAFVFVYRAKGVRHEA